MAVAVNSKLGAKAGLAIYGYGVLPLVTPTFDARLTDGAYNPLITFSRASARTYFDRDGLLKTTPVNLLTYSTDFSNAAWVVTSGGTGSVAVKTPNYGLAPDGTMTACRVQLNKGAGTTTSDISEMYHIASPSDSENKTRSVWVKSLSGTVQAIVGVTSASTPLITESWQRIALSAASGERFRIMLRGGQAQTNSATADLLVWHPQNETGSQATEFIPTTSTVSGSWPLEFDPATGVCIGRSVWEARTNYLVDSAFSSFSGATANDVWIEVLSELDTTVSAAVAPDNTTSAALVAVNANAANRSISQRTGETSAGTYTASVFAKAASTDTEVSLFLAGEVSATNGARAAFTLTELGSAGAPSLLGTGASASSSITYIGNGWYRCVLTVTLSAPTNITLIIYPGTRTAQTTASRTFLWGAQLEAGAFATPYIPTTTAAATRAADVVSVTGTNFSSWFNATEGTFVVEVYGGAGVSGSSNAHTFSVNNGTAANRMFIRQSSALSSADCSVYSASVLQAGLVSSNGSWPNGSASIRRITLAVKENMFGAAYNGQSLGEDLTGAVPAVDRMYIGSPVGADNYLNGHISRLVYYPKRLPDNVLRGLTS